MMMHRSLMAGLLTVTLSLSACGPSAATPTPSVTPGPRLVVEKETLNFGRIRFDQWVRAQFRITNAGTQPLALQVPPLVRLVEGC
jgi:hypothetical protein